MVSLFNCSKLLYASYNRFSRSELETRYKYLFVTYIISGIYKAGSE